MSDIDKLLDYLRDLNGGKGPATEQTMQDIAKGLNVDLSGGIVKTTGKNMEETGNQAKDLGKSLLKLTTAFGSTIAAVVDFAKEQRKASIVLRDLGNALDPTGLTKGFAAMLGVMDDNMGAFRKLSQAGESSAIVYGRTPPFFASHQFRQPVSVSLLPTILVAQGRTHLLKDQNQ